MEPTQGGEEIFVHKGFPPGTGRPAVGLPLSFEVELGPQGKKRAKAVEFIRTRRPGRRARSESPAPWTPARIVVIPGFLLLYAFVASHASVKPVVAMAYLLASLLAFMAYALDKSAALQGRWRISETALHVFSRACGWPGALLAQQLLRHKSSKPSFRSTCWGTVALNVAGFFAVHSPWVAAAIP